MFAIIFFGILGLLFLFCGIIPLFSTIIFSVKPALSFKLHAFFVKKGLSLTFINDNGIKITNHFLTMEFRKSLNFSENKILRIETNYYDGPFSFSYNLKTNEITKFECNEVFSSGLNQDKFKKMLDSYLSVAIKKFWKSEGKKDKATENHESLIENMNGTLFSKGKNNALVSSNLNFKVDMPVNLPERILLSLHNMESNLEDAKKNISRLDVYDKHYLSNLIEVRLPKLLEYYNQLEPDKQMSEEGYLFETIDMIEKKINNLNEISTNETENEYEREKLLMKNMF